jgi:hypothetical protein
VLLKGCEEEDGEGTLLLFVSSIIGW